MPTDRVLFVLQEQVEASQLEHCCPLQAVVLIKAIALREFACFSLLNISTVSNIPNNSSLIKVRL